MIWYAKVAKRLLEELDLGIINFATSALAPLPRASRTIEYEYELDVECEKFADAIKKKLSMP